MITEAYTKGRFDYGVGKCAVVIVEGGEVIHQVAWRVPDSWEFNGDTIVADQYNCEILAATYVVNWCRQNGRKTLNIYSNLATCQKWYYRDDFPDGRVMGKAFIDAHGKDIDVYAEYIPKSSDNEFNQLVNELAENVK